MLAASSEFDQTIVKSKTRLVDRANPLRQNAWPRDGKAIGPNSKISHQRYVLAVTMIMVAGDITSVAVGDRPRLPAIDIPNALAAAILMRGAFDLIARRRDPPDKVMGPLADCHLMPLLSRQARYSDGRVRRRQGHAAAPLRQARNGRRPFHSPWINSPPLRQINKLLAASTSLLAFRTSTRWTLRAIFVGSAIFGSTMSAWSAARTLRLGSFIPSFRPKASGCRMDLP